MYATLGWVLLAGLPLSSPATNDTAVHAPARPPVAAGRVAVWSDRDDPYDRGDAARVYLSAQQAAHVAVFRVDTDGRIRVLFPREPWGDTWVRAVLRSSRCPAGVGDAPSSWMTTRGSAISSRSRRADPSTSTTSRGATTGTIAPSTAAASPATRTWRSPTSPCASPRATTTITTSAPTTWNDGTTIPGSPATTATPTPSTTSGTPIAGPAPDSGWSSTTTPATTPIASGAAGTW